MLCSDDHFYASMFFPSAQVNSDFFHSFLVKPFYLDLVNLDNVFPFMFGDACWRF